MGIRRGEEDKGLDQGCGCLGRLGLELVCNTELESVGAPFWSVGVKLGKVTQVLADGGV
jgi:hypothetical protein